jgi:ribonuclease R
MDSSSLEAQVLEFVLAPNYQPVKPRVIAKKLGLPEDQKDAVRKTVKRLVKAGKLQFSPNHMVRAPRQASPPATSKQTSKAPKSTEQNQITGRFRRAQAGFGFVRPVGTPKSHGNEQDIFIPENRTGDAVTGDLVAVEINYRKRASRGGFEGKIVEVVERETHQFVGTYFEAAGQAMVQVDGSIFAQPIRVGDPGAKNARPDDKVVFEMVRFPSPWHAGEGVITEVLGSRGDPGVDTLTIIREFELPEHFAEDTLAAARQQADQFDESIPDDRLDLTRDTVITIDPVDARDFDDAISLTRLENGHWRLGVHIADVAHFVPVKTPLDREAHNRATSVYLPDRVIPMLPEIISNSLASLQPDRVRYAKTAFIEFTDEGVRVAVDLRRTAIKSCRRFTYEEVDEYLADREAWKARLEPAVHTLLGRMHELAMTLRRRRIQRGALELTLGEIKIDLDRDGKVAGAHQVVNTESHQVIEEFMLAANDAVAEHLRDQSLLFLRRIHEAPDPRKLQELTDFVKELGFKTESLESRFEIQKLLKEVAGKPEERAVNYAILRSMQQAVYGPADEGHYALASDCYCHFTSPIRRYPDLLVHRLLDALWDQKKPVQDLAELAALGDHCSQRERRAEAAERELTKIKLLHYLEERVGMEMDAVVTGVAQFGMFAQGIELPAEGLVHVTSLADDYYRFERASHALVGYRQGNAYRLGDKIRVAVARVDVDRRELDLRVVGRGKRGASPPRASLPLRRDAKPRRDGDKSPAPVKRKGVAKTPRPKKQGRR